MNTSGKDNEWPHHQVGRELSNWGRWGEDDEIGTLNFVTADKRIAAARLVRRGQVFNLSMPMDKNGPFGRGDDRINPVHVMTLLPEDGEGSPDGEISTDDMVTTGLQSSTQWDSLAHVGYGGRFYNGAPASSVSASRGAEKNSFPKVLEHLVSRGVLLDIAQVKGVDRLPDSYEITPEDLESAERSQGVHVESGDILLIRTGWYLWFLEGDSAHFLGNSAGLGIECCQWLSERQVAAVATDNWTCEVWPSTIAGSQMPFHQIAIRDMGLTLGEMFNLEELAADCHADRVFDFLVCAPGLNITGAVGSPVSPLAIK
ncbi:cyclase family protein [Nocardia rhamnosiphila]